MFPSLSLRYFPNIKQISMFTTKQTLILLLLLPFTFLNGQNIEKLLVEKKWSAYDNFVIIDFQKGGKAVLEYAYCTYCRGNKDTLDWSVKKKLLLLGGDSLLIKNHSSKTIITHQYQRKFALTALEKIKPSEFIKEDITRFLTSSDSMFIKVKSTNFDNSKKKAIHFNTNGKMWMGNSKYRGQWALKYFYGSLFLIYVNRYAVNKDFPLIKILEFNENKLTGLPIPSIKRGSPFMIEIIPNSGLPLAEGGE